MVLGTQLHVCLWATSGIYSTEQIIITPLLLFKLSFNKVFITRFSTDAWDTPSYLTFIGIYVFLKLNSSHELRA